MDLQKKVEELLSPIFEQLEQLQSKNERLKERIKELESKIKLAYENFSVWISMNKGHICMGESQRQQYNEILQALKGE